MALHPAGSCAQGAPLAHPDPVPVPAAQLAELERRLDEDDANPDALLPVEVALRRLREA
jgi:hypothetical protein